MQGVAPQNRHVQSVTDQFLQIHWDQKSPLLLGYSGGPDSKALLYSLLDCGVKPDLVHVDHGWRCESAEEAQALHCEAQSLGLLFFSAKLAVCKKEDVARAERLKAFFSFYSNHQALLLAHTKDDLAETVLKRLFEGAHLFNLGGMEQQSFQFGMTVWRPFLGIKRREILQFLEEKSLTFIQDPSNVDPQYLRARMRKEIFPYLQTLFGKQIQDNLAHLSERSFELKKYFEERLYAACLKKGPWGILVDLSGLHLIEKRYLLQKVGSEHSVALSREVLETLLKWVENSVKSKYLTVGNQKIFVDGNRVWWPRA